MFCKKGSMSKSDISPESLPPTADAEGYHSLRSYHQVQTWRGSKNFNPLKLVWKVQKGMMIAIPDCHSYSTEISTARVTEDISLQLWDRLQNIKMYLCKTWT